MKYGRKNVSVVVRDLIGDNVDKACSTHRTDGNYI
jgi:hypothetical protein